MTQTAAKTDSLLKRCRESGHAAFFAKIAKSDCPFAKGSAARREWLRGWNKAKRNIQRSLAA